MNTHLLFILLGNAGIFNVISSRPAALNLFKDAVPTENPIEEKYQYTRILFQGAHEPLKHPLLPRAPAANARTNEEGHLRAVSGLCP